MHTVYHHVISVRGIAPLMGFAAVPSHHRWASVAQQQSRQPRVSAKTTCAWVAANSPIVLTGSGIESVRSQATSSLVHERQNRAEAYSPRVAHIAMNAPSLRYEDPSPADILAAEDPRIARNELIVAGIAGCGAVAMALPLMPLVWINQGTGRAVAFLGACLGAGATGASAAAILALLRRFTVL